MKQVHICSIKEFRWLLRNKQLPLENSYALISSSYPLDIPELSRMGYSFECYDDIDFDCLGRSFSFEGANKFAKAIKANDDIRTWWCVCDGGHNRSSASACALLRYLGDETKELAIWRDPDKSPNPLVYEMLCTALGTPVDTVDLDLRIYTNRTAIKNATKRDK